jgi:hypothetical protein
MNAKHGFALLLLLFLFACEGKSGNVLTQPPLDFGPAAQLPAAPLGESTASGDPTGPGPAPVPPACSTSKDGKGYIGLGGYDLTGDRQDSSLQLDRGRVKPYPVLASEYSRALGTVPGLYPQMASTFGAPPARWLDEPEASAIILYSAFRIGFQGCLDYTARSTAYVNAPAAETAPAECRAFALKFWNRLPTDSELARCTELAMTDTAKETNPRRRWAYVCASALTASGFLTY